MKFADIPKFTRSSPHSPNVPLGYLKSWINEQIDELSLQLNPDFQRGHVWTTEQQISYVEYLLRGGRSGRDMYFNMPGWMGNWEGEFVCVDGLQRITACLAFVNNKLPAFGTYLDDFEDRLRMADVTLIININNLKTRKEVLTWYLEMNTGGTPHTDLELDKVRKLIDKY